MASLIYDSEKEDIRILHQMLAKLIRTYSFSGTVICIVGLFMAIFAITILEKERLKRKTDKS